MNLSWIKMVMVTVAEWELIYNILMKANTP